MANRLKHELRATVLRALCEGCSIRATSRMTGVHPDSIGRAILDFGTGCHNLLDERLRGLTLDHIEVDEVWTFVAKKQARLTVEEKALRSDIGDVYLWTALDASTKLLVTYALGKRSADNARRLMVDLSERLVIPRPHESDERGYVAITQISTDGFAGYPEAVDLAFGPYAKYGVLIKEYRNADANGGYAPSELVATDRRVIKGQFDPRSICTSHVERNNLTIRTFMRRFTRLSLGFSKKLECLTAACGMFAGYYNLIWRTRYPDKSGRPGKKRPTAAMMAGVTDHLWDFNELYWTAIQYC